MFNFLQKLDKFKKIDIRLQKSIFFDYYYDESTISILPNKEMPYISCLLLAKNYEKDPYLTKIETFNTQIAELSGCKDKEFVEKQLSKINQKIDKIKENTDIIHI